MRLAELVRRLGGAASPLEGDGPTITGVHLDSRRVGAGDLFCALPGGRDDGACFTCDAAERGAAAVLLPRAVPSIAAIPQWVHPEARRVAGQAASLVLGEPARGLRVIAVTGTNGKTTVAHLAGALLRAGGLRPAVLGTTGNRLADGVLRAAGHTTPDAPSLLRLLAEHRALGGDSVALEASSHALDQERLSGLEVDVAVFTNLTRDHLDYHGTMERYAAAKERLFLSLRPGTLAVVNADDPVSGRMAAAARLRGARVLTYGTRTRGDLCASALRVDLSGTELVLQGMGISRTRLRLPLVGRHNVENALAAATAVLGSGASPSSVLDGLATASSAPGRLEPVPAPGRGFHVLVDYAHTEDALVQACRAVREAREGTAGRRGRLILVFGCGGERDPGKRGPMGRAANELADIAVLTSDNPRGEDPQSILEQVLEGMAPPRTRTVIEPDRARAIGRALSLARKGDVVLITGKGHETTQTAGGRVVAFDDRLVAAESLP